MGREPLFHFFILGVLLWCGIEYWNAEHSRYTIYIGPEQQHRIASAYRQQFGQLPTPEQLRILLDQYIREEIFVREAMALDMDKDDEIIRRRLLQKYEFLRTDLSTPEDPDPATLEQWFHSNGARYGNSERVEFRQIYFAADSGGEKAARRRALAALNELMRSHGPLSQTWGDDFPGPTNIGALTREGAMRLFGHSELAGALFSLPAGRWVGPLRSGYGWHLVYVTGRVASQVPPLAQIEAQVRADYMEAQRRVMNARSFATLRAKYTIRYDEASP